MIWLEFMEEEPHGEERQDLRIGALGSILLNTTLDTRDEGPLLPDSYIAGWDNERTFYLTVKSPQLLEEERLARERGEAREQQSRGRKLDFFPFLMAILSPFLFFLLRLTTGPVQAIYYYLFACL